MGYKTVILDQIRENLAPIAGLLDDSGISEIMVTADGRVWVERAGTIDETDIVLVEESRAVALRAIAKTIAGGADMRSGEASSVISTTVEGMRFAGALMPIESRGTTLCIRKHLDPESRPTLENLVEWGSVDQWQADFLIQKIINEKLNAVIIGATSSGKTTLTNAILAKIPEYERIGLIEDAQELAPKVKNCDRYTTNIQKGVDARLLIKHAMRSRYDRLILGETRGDDTFDLIRALSSGHNGSMTTLHANSAADGMNTLEMLYQMSLPEGAQIPVEVSRPYLASAINLLVFAQRIYVPQPDGTAKSERRIKEIAIVKPHLKDGKYDFEYAKPDTSN
jgi:Flp pilus assembly CpaF family ATPase